MPEALNEADRVGPLGEFASPELEAAYRARLAPDARRLTLLMIGSSTAAVLAMGYQDYTLFPDGPQLRWLWTARVAYALLSVAAFVVIRSERAAYDQILGWWLLTGIALYVCAGAVWPAGSIELRIAAALSVLMCYCILPLPFRFQVVAAVLHTGAWFAVALWLNPPSDHGSVLGDMCWLFIVNALGVVLSRNGHIRQRILFVTLIRQSELSAKLGKALAEVRTLRGLIQVCAWCHKVHADNDRWQQLESYVRDHSHAEFTHGICPPCLAAATGDADNLAEMNGA
ncbi:hypothetical protein [Zavarzinella formosa]|uniref:hypothetical protein n=1 Tax=Zavarzinella formosa TaxID=360055 RepID=UPI00037239DA|nr:hypothetical protein [Zavarzinella formosa]